MLLFYFTLLLGAGLQAPAPNVGGVWTLNRLASNTPREIGFNAPWLEQGARGASGSTGGNQSGSSGGRGRRGGGGGGGGASGSPFGAPSESYDEARRVQFLTGEARNPAMRITIVDTPAAITITNELGQSRTLHPTGRDEEVEVGGVPLSISTRRDANALVVTYIVDKDRQVRYTYTPSAAPAQLVVDVQFVEHGSGDKARLVYEPGIATTDTYATPTSSAPPSGGMPASQPAAPMPTGTDTRPGAELRGLKQIGVLVEDLGPQAQSCGLSHDAIESALTKRLSDAGFTVRRNSDEDTYLYVNIQTSTIAGGVCVSRYDGFLYTHAAATLSYREQPVLVQVSLMHRGGIGTSAPSGHASAVTRALENYVDVMVTQIRDANK
jgi:hypothetical protein